MRFSPAQTPSQANSVNASLRVRLIIVATQHRTMTHYAIAGEVVRLLPIPSAFVASLANEEDLGHPSIHQLPVRPLDSPGGEATRITMDEKGEEGEEGDG